MSEYASVSTELNQQTNGEGVTYTHFFDLISGEIIIESNDILESTDIVVPPHIRPLGELLLTDEIDTLDIHHYRQQEKMHWSKNRCEEYGKWLLEIVQASDPSSTLSYEILKRARILGFGIGPATLIHPSMYGRLANFYLAAEIPKSKTNKVFTDWDISDFATAIQSLINEIGRIPTRIDINEKASRTPGFPSYGTVKEIGLRKVLEYLSYANVYSWTREDYISHGIRFMFANDGMEPSQTAWDHFSKLKLGPSAKATSDFFPGKFGAYKAEVIQNYTQEIEAEQNFRDLQMKLIEKGQKNNALPPELFAQADSDDEMITRFIKYQVVNELLPECSEETKVKISTGAYQNQGFISSIRRKNSSITVGDIESTALYLGVYDKLWPMVGHLKKLKLPDEFIQARSSYLKGQENKKKRLAKQS